MENIRPRLSAVGKALRFALRPTKDAHAEVRDYLVPAVDSDYRGREQVQRDEAMRSCAIAMFVVAGKDISDAWPRGEN